MATSYLSFETDRLLIRPTDESDAAFLLELLNTPKWLANIGDREVYTLADAVAYVRRRILPQLQRLGYANYTLIRRHDGVRIGCCGLYDREGLSGVDLGFALLPAFEGKGYAFEASSRILRAAWEEFALPELSAITTPGNRSSQQLLEKLGFERVGQIRLLHDPEELLHYRLSHPPPKR
jgi:RimJ/RimL family protein N-acetyltransferase